MVSREPCYLDIKSLFCSNLESLRMQILCSHEYATLKRLRHDNTLYPKTRISFMLDSMIVAVDDGFSYDGIVSVPKT